jgi:hypothetical protein
VPTAVAGTASVGAVRATLGAHGRCRNDAPLTGFFECRGTCPSGTLYNNGYLLSIYLFLFLSILI